MSHKGFPSFNQPRGPQQQAAAARQQFVAAFRGGRVAVLDRFGNTVKAGDHVIWRPPHDLVYQVTDAVPVMDPNLPPGFVRLMLQVTVPIQYPVGKRHMDLMTVAVEDDKMGATVPAGAATADQGEGAQGTDGETPNGADSA